MLLSRLVEVSQRVAETSKRLQKTGLIADLIREASVDEVRLIVLYLSGSTRQGRIGIGYSTLRDAAGTSAAEPSLALLELDAMLETFAGIKGKGSQQAKGELLHTLFSRATESEKRFLFGLLTGELRQGALEGVMIEAIAKASDQPVEIVRRAAMMAGNLDEIAHAAITEGSAGLARYDIQLFCPVQPMLAGSAEEVSDALEELGEAALEYKLDGARIQVHKSGDQVAVYSRQLNEVTGAVPEVVEAVRALPASDLILDGEVIALQPSGRPHPFQVTMRRFGRKLDVDAMRSELPLTPFFFDAVYADGSLVDESQTKRFSVMQEIAPSLVIPHTFTADRAEAEQFFAESLERGHEGVMAKAPAAPYAAGSRGQSWLKVKKARTLDLVILAAEWGNGRRQGWLSNLHLGARDPERNGWAMLGKTFKGLTDEMLKWQTEELQKIEVARDSYTVYVEPRIVVEIAFNEIQVSPRYERGLALRFARVKRYRTDKTADQADTLATVQTMAGIP